MLGQFRPRFSNLMKINCNWQKLFYIQYLVCTKGMCIQNILTRKFQVLNCVWIMFYTIYYSKTPQSIKTILCFYEKLSIQNVNRASPT